MNSPVELWGITSYFNPSGYRRRLTNYHAFRGRLKIPLIAVELCLGDDFELRPRDADRLVQIRGGAVLWQKERLLNLALKSLPRECSKVVWIDCDTIVEAEDWPWRVSAALDDCRLVQPFARICHLKADACGNEGLVDKSAFSEPSIAYAIRRGQIAGPSLDWTIRRDEGTLSKGSIWAARRELLDSHGFFDACIVGGADKAITYAAYGCHDDVARHHAMNEYQREYYLAWAKPFFRDIQGDVTYVDGDVFHLWHGSMSDRRYRDRHEGIRPFHFDPSRDIAVADNGAWQWNSDKPLLHQYVKEYFAQRKEDGLP
jgi:hypothetical protein